jgi:3,4-dihydroxy 2-butanone 4-phosphate synthase/GTP cyclohydrolase II
MEKISQFVTVQKKGRGEKNRPLVTLSYAQSLDGSIAAFAGVPLALSGPESLKLTHQLRAVHHAIVVGIGTVLADDPQLTVRMVNGVNPQPIILDSHLRTPPHANLVNHQSLQPWIFTTDTADLARQASLEAQGARVFRLPKNTAGKVSLPDFLTSIAGMGVARLMVEGGAQVITAFLAQRLVDQIVLTITPSFVGGLRSLDDLLQITDRPNLNADHITIDRFPRIRDLEIEKLGEDIVLWGNLDWGNM